MPAPTRPYDIIEISPTGLARCRACKSLIDKDSTRIEIQNYQRDCNEWWAFYYHHDCAKRITGLMENANFQPRLPSSKRKSFEDDIVVEGRKKKRRISESRSDLREVLRSTRNSLAEDLNKEIYMIFPNYSLEALVERMPTTRNELMKVPGFAWYRSTTYGPIFLPIIQKYKREMQELEPKVITTFCTPFVGITVADDEVCATSKKYKIESRQLKPEFGSTLDSTDDKECTVGMQVTKVSCSEKAKSYNPFRKKSSVADDAWVSSRHYKMKPRRLEPEFGSTLDSADSNEGKIHIAKNRSFAGKRSVNNKWVSSITRVKTCRVSNRTRSKTLRVSSRTRSKRRRV